MADQLPTICWDDADSQDDPRRSEQRTSVTREVDLVLLDSFDRPSQQLRVPTINITRGGIGVFVDQPLTLGAHVIVVLPARKGAKRTPIGGIVRFCSAKPVDQRFHRIGVEFLPREAMTSAFAAYDDWRLTA